MLLSVGNVMEKLSVVEKQWMFGPRGKLLLLFVCKEVIFVLNLAVQISIV